QELTELAEFRLNDHLAEASERGDDLVGQNRRNLSEHMASDELVGGLLDDQCHIDGVTQTLHAHDEAVVLHNHGWGILSSRANSIGKFNGSGHDEWDAGNLADECGLCGNRQEREACETQDRCLWRMG